MLQHDALHTAFLIEPLDGAERQPAFVTKEVDMLEADIPDLSAGCIIGAYLHGKHLSATRMVEPNIAESDVAEGALIAAHDCHGATPGP